MDGLMFLLDQAGRSIIALQAQIAVLEAEKAALVEKITSEAEKPGPVPGSSGVRCDSESA